MIIEDEFKDKRIKNVKKLLNKNLITFKKSNYIPYLNDILSHSLIEKRYDIFEYLNKKHPKEYFNIYSPFNKAISNFDKEAIHYILSIENIDKIQDDFINDCLINGIFNHFNEAVIFIIHDERADKQELFHTACKNNNLEIAKYINDNFEINPMFQNNKIFISSSQSKHYKVLDYLIKELGVNPAGGYCRAFLSANFQNDEKMKIYLLQYKEVRDFIKERIPDIYKELKPLIIKHKMNDF